MNYFRTSILLLAGGASAGVPAQTVSPSPPPPAATVQAEPIEADDSDEDLDEGEEIIVTGTRQRGAVAGDIPAEITLNPSEIRALGASSLGDLLAALAPQTGSGRGRGDGGPVVLLNGRRISGFGEIRDLPPEAIERVDILPEEVALSYGYRADQRVVNFVLRPRFRALTVEAEGGLPTAGGRSSVEFDLNMLRIDRVGRWSLDAEYSRDGVLLESERDIIQTDGGVDGGRDEARFRTLLPRTERLQLGGTVNRGLPGDVSATLTARYDDNETRSLFGLPSALVLGELGSALTRDGRNRTGQLGLSLNGSIQPWRWTLTGNLDRTATLALTDVDGPTTMRDRARSVDQSGNVQMLVNGPLFDLPAGRVSATVRAGAAFRDFSSASERSGLFQGVDLSRDRADVQGSVDVPIASRRDGVLSALGDLSLNANYAIERLSDFGTLDTYGAGVNWEPFERVRLLASYMAEAGAPSVQQLGDAVLVQPGARVFDFTRGETVDVIRVDGGNPDLIADDRRVIKLGLTVQPLSETDLTLRADYTDNRTRDAIASFPAATGEIEAAFPDRFTRDADGRLLRIDNRAVNFARTERKELRWGLNYSKPIGPADPTPAQRRALREQRRAAAGQVPGAVSAPGTRGPGQPPRGQAGPGERGAGAGQPGGGFGRGGGRGGFGGGFGGRGGGRFGANGGGQGNLQLGLFHTWRFTDTILIRNGVPELDLLDGSAVGNRGGRPRHEVEFQSGIFRKGLGARLTANYQSGTFVNGLASAPAESAGDLRFGDFATVNLRLFADLGAQEALVRRYRFLRGARVSIAVDNLFDARLQVRDDGGLTPIGFQGDLLDPLGRSVRVSLRKLFF